MIYDKEDFKIRVLLKLNRNTKNIYIIILFLRTWITSKNDRTKILKVYKIVVGDFNTSFSIIDKVDKMLIKVIENLKNTMSIKLTQSIFIKPHY